MKQTLDQIITAHPEMRAKLTDAAMRYTPASFDNDGNPLYSVNGLLMAAGAMSGNDAFSRGVKDGRPGVTYR